MMGFKSLLHVPNRSGKRKTAWGMAVLVMGIGALHHYSGYPLNFFALFLIPTMLAAWMLGLQAGVAIALSSALIGFASDISVMPGGGILLHLVNALIRFMVFGMVAWSTWKIGEQSQRLATLAYTDTLTGLNNRRAFLQRGAEEVARAKRDGLPFTVMFVDLDGFKQVNDRYGHDAGDALLRKVAGVLRSRLRKTDFVARMGGDEFAAILPATAALGAWGLADNLRKTLAAVLHEGDAAVTASIGVATFSGFQGTFADALGRADALMYEVKKSTKNAVLQREFNT